MSAMPQIFIDNGFEVVYGSDQDRSGAFLELGRRSPAGWNVVAELFSAEQGGAVRLSTIEDLPADVIQAFIEYGRARLAAPGWGRLTSA